MGFQLTKLFVLSRTSRKSKRDYATKNPSSTMHHKPRSVAGRIYTEQSTPKSIWLLILSCLHSHKQTAVPISRGPADDYPTVLSITAAWIISFKTPNSRLRETTSSHSLVRSSPITSSSRFIKNPLGLLISQIKFASLM